MAKTYKPVPQQTEPTAPDDADLEEGGEDTRDVWDKALDYAPTIGMFAGATLGGRWGAKRSAKLYKQGVGLEKKINKLRAKGGNPNVGISDKEYTDLRKAEADLEHVRGEWASNIAGRTLVKAPAGAIAGRVAGGAVQDTFQKRRRK